MIDAAEKTQFAVRLMHVARDMARSAGDERQQRVLARYTLMHADSAHRYLSQWKREHEASPVTRPLAQAAKTPLKRFRQEYAHQKETRDRLVARRVSMASGRAADLRNTAALWQSITARGVDHLCWRALRASEALGARSGLDAELAPGARGGIADALQSARLDPRSVYLDATSYASGERNMLPVTPGGAAGAVVMRINDHQSHLETLYSLREFADRDDDVGLLLRGALVVDTSALVEAAIGSVAHSRQERSRASLIDVVPRERGESAYDELLRLRDEVIPEQTRINLRDMRDRIAAHLDAQTTLDQIKATLGEVSARDLYRLVDKVLTWLDTIAPGHVDLGTLVIGYRKMKTLSPAHGPTLPAQFQPADYARFLDQPYLIMTGGGFGPAANAGVAGAISSRVTRRRQPWFPEAGGEIATGDGGGVPPDPQQSADADNRSLTGPS